jgi:hypothetical protein
MPAGKYSTYIPYTPGAPPSEITTRPVWDELYKVSQSMIDLDRPVSLSLQSVEPLNATITPGSFTRLFNGGEISEWEQPGGSFNHSTGIYTVATEGLYQIYIRLNTPPFPSSQVKEYESQIQWTVDFVDPLKPIKNGIVEAGGQDTATLTNQGMMLLPLVKGDVFYFDARLIRQAGAASNIQNTAMLQVIRMSGVK